MAQAELRAERAEDALAAAESAEENRMDGARAASGAEADSSPTPGAANARRSAAQRRRRTTARLTRDQELLSRIRQLEMLLATTSEGSAIGSHRGSEPPVARSQHPPEHVARLHGATSPPLAQRSPIRATDVASSPPSRTTPSRASGRRAAGPLYALPGYGAAHHGLSPADILRRGLAVRGRDQGSPAISEGTPGAGEAPTAPNSATVSSPEPVAAPWGDARGDAHGEVGDVDATAGGEESADPEHDMSNQLSMALAQAEAAAAAVCDGRLANLVQLLERDRRALEDTTRREAESYSRSLQLSEDLDAAKRHTAAAEARAAAALTERRDLTARSERSAETAREAVARVRSLQAELHAAREAERSATDAMRSLKRRCQRADRLAKQKDELEAQLSALRASSGRFRAIALNKVTCPQLSTAAPTHPFSQMTTRWPAWTNLNAV